MSLLPSVLHQLIADHQEALLGDWRARLGEGAQIEAAELRVEMTELLAALQAALGCTDAADAEPALQALDAALRDASQRRAARGHTPEASVQ